MRGSGLAFFYMGLTIALLPGVVGADVTPTAKDFEFRGTNRAQIQAERAAFSERLDLDDQVDTLVKQFGSAKLPEEVGPLYQLVDPVPLESSKVMTPWLSYFKEAVAFVIGRLDRLRIARWSVRLHDPSGKEIKAFTGLGHPPEAFFWNGRDYDFRPVSIGQAYIPEIFLVDVYGARVNLPQKVFQLDQFIWEEPGQMRLGLTQEAIFRPKRQNFSKEGVLIIQEASQLINLQEALILEIECVGPDRDLSEDRAEALKQYFARENLPLKKIQVTVSTAAGVPVVYLNALKAQRRP